MNTLKDRIAQRLEALDMKKADLARRLKVEPQYINNWIARDSLPSKWQMKMASILQCDTVWLVFGAGTPDIPEQGEIFGNVSEAPDIKGSVPLISWVRAGTWSEAEDYYYPGDGEEMIPCVEAHGKHTYALRVEGDSMTASHGRSVPHGSIIYVDPDQVAGVVVGDLVIAKINGDDKVTFKSYQKDWDRPVLKPLNPQYSIIRDEFRVIGKVIGMHVAF